MTTSAAFDPSSLLLAKLYATGCPEQAVEDVSFHPLTRLTVRRCELADRDGIGGWRDL
jgi:hypothetical protein